MQHRYDLGARSRIAKKERTKDIIPNATHIPGIRQRNARNHYAAVDVACWKWGKRLSKTHPLFRTTQYGTYSLHLMQQQFVVESNLPRFLQNNCKTYNSIFELHAVCFFSLIKHVSNFKSRVGSFFS